MILDLIFEFAGYILADVLAAGIGKGYRWVTGRGARKSEGADE